MFQQTVNLVDEAGLSALHVFPFSARPQTPAARMPQLDRAIVKARAARLRAKGMAASNARLASLVGTTQTLLVERGGIGRTECFVPVAIEGAAPANFVRAKITGLSNGRLIGALAA
jgi:threonylcarbamoyladenosine tRNA methylthiotransferase MtaB